MLGAFYNELNEGEEPFFGNWRWRWYSDDYELESGNDNNDAENQADVTEVEQEIEQIEEEDAEMENIVKKHQMNPEILQQFNGNKSSKLSMMF